MRHSKSVLTALLLVACIGVAVIAPLLHAPVTVAEVCAGEYLNVLSAVENITLANPRYVDLSYLGSHDSFSNQLSINSEFCEYDINADIVGNLYKLGTGALVRYSKTQVSGAAGQLAAGVRLFDVRITEYEGEWYTYHGLISGRLSGYLDEIIDFLSTQKGEIVTFLMQETHVGTKTHEELFKYIHDYERNGKKMSDFIRYNTLYPMRELTYNDLTANGTSSGIVLAYLEGRFIRACPNYVYTKGISGGWIPCTNAEERLRKMDEEIEFKIQHGHIGLNFVLVQAQLSVDFSTPEARADVISGWSLLDMAEEFNVAFIEDEKCDERLEKVYTYWFDYVECDKNNFNARINAKMLERNRRVCDGILAARVQNA